MSRRFRRSKPLGANKKNMKNGSGESPKPSQTAQGSAAIFDFLYVDRARVSALYAQLFPQGVLTAVKTNSQQSFSEDFHAGSDIKIFKAESRSVDGGAESIEHQFDASWAIPLEVLAALEGRGLVSTSLAEAGLGRVLLADAHMRIIDYSDTGNLWVPAMKLAALNETQPENRMTPETAAALAEAMKAMPRAIHAHFLTREGYLWSSLQPTSLTIPQADLSLKYGGTIPGLWKVLYILDSWPDDGAPPNVEGWSAGDVIDGVLSSMHALRVMAGRPASWAGITPLMIFRDMRGWLPVVQE